MSAEMDLHPAIRTMGGALAFALAFASFSASSAEKATAGKAADEANGTIAVNGKIYRRKRVRVRVGRRHRPRHHSHRGPSILGIFLSFGQWIRYSVRSWMLYR